MAKKAAILIAAVGLAAALYVASHRRVSGTRASGSLPAAPALALTDLGGSSISLPSYKGKVVLINFWAAWCAPCRDEIPQFVALQDRYRSQGFQAVGISMDDPEGTLRDFCRDYRVNYPVVIGDQKIAEAFGGVLGLPTSFLVGRDGRMRGRFEGATDFPRLEQDITALLRAGP